MKIAFIGLGAMGQPMARNLARAGHELLVYNRTPERAQALAGEVASVASTVGEAACEAEVVVTMLADDGAVEEVVFGAPAEGGQVTEGILGSMPSGAVHVSMSTIGPPLALRLAQAHHSSNQAFVSAPVFGRPEMAEAARLWLVVAGDRDPVERCRPVFQAMGAGHTVVGQQPWLANVMKLAGNFALASMVETVGEAFALARKSGIGAEAFLEVFTRGLAWTPIYEAYARVIAEGRFEPGFTLALGLKDMRLASQAADAAAVPMPFLSIVHGHLLEASARGQGERDWSVVARLAAERAGLEPPA
ncbi:MAG TPA: NAD(P)-dependent oxidoreductase [Vicinamibacterales bacterium]|nr:NAD(P)-dependent oxidoreductase [Vicinamibacterales bacterium]